jgi:hypothetical protein
LTSERIQDILVVLKRYRGIKAVAQNYVTHKAAFMLSLEARKERMRAYGKENNVNPYIWEQKRTWGDYEQQIINMMNCLKASHPSFDWEVDWLKVKGV